MRRKRTTLAVLVAAATLVTTAQPAGAASVDRARAGSAATGAVTAAPEGAAATAFSVTLITGDRVLVHGADGARSAVITPGPGRKGMAFLQQSGGEVGQDTFEVIPLDARRLIEAGRLDRRLFDVLTLQRFGYDDAHAGATPLMVTGPGAARSALTRFPGATVTRTLPVIDAAAISSSKKDAVGFWAALRRGGAGSTLAAGLTRVHLDGKSTVVDEQSNAQVGAPAAWAAGYTGAGITAAVLDTGIDETHPDLKGKVAEAVDFTGSEDGAKDTNGHGTHVAATLAGSGSASAGKHTGVAPDAKLLVGRVCGESGTCQDSDVIAGMEWAASKARLVSMSLGSPVASDGTDLMSRAVNELSAKTGALFVIAAGNSGPRAGTIGSPAAADAALTVGSVGRTNAASRFSSRGPRLDGAVKPDLTAPGENIVSARAVGTDMGSPVDEHYTAASGTSMATPHISGAAAVLAQARPTWTGAQLKSALTGSALANGDLPFVQGAGRLDLARAVRQTVYAGDSLRLGRISAPFAAKPVVRRTLTYHNAGADAVTLGLTATAGIGATTATPLPAGALTLSASALTVPAGGDASVEVAVDPAALDGATFGPLSGRVVAKDDASDVTVQTTFGGIVEPESYDVTVDLVDRHGKPITIGERFTHSVQLHSHDLAVADHGPETDVTASRVTMRVQKGTYALASLITTAETPENPYGTESFTVLTQPKLTVDRDITLTLDARTANPVRPVVDAAKPQRRNAFVEEAFEVRRGGNVLGYSTSTLGTGSTQPFYARTIGASDRMYRFLYRSDVATAPGVSPAHLYHLAIVSQGRAPDGLAGRIRDRDLATVRSRYRAQGANTVAMRAEWIEWYPKQSGFASLFVDDIPLPSRLVEHYSTQGVRYRGLLEQRLETSYPAPDGTTLTAPRTYRRGDVTLENWNAPVLGPNLGELNDPDIVQVSRTGDRLFVSVPMFSTPEPNHGMWSLETFGLRGSTTVLKDGVVLGKTPFAGLAGVNLPTADPAVYELEVDGTRPYSWVDVGTRLKVKWEFTSTGTADAERLPLKTVRIIGPTLDDNSAAPGGGFTPLILRVQTQMGATAVPVKSVAAEFSADDGTTWSPLQVFDSGDYYGVLVQNPKVGGKGGYVSLRVKVTDTAGGSVEQTHIRAYKLAG